MPLFAAQRLSSAAALAVGCNDLLCCMRIAPFGYYMPYLHLTLSFNFDPAAWFADELIINEFISRVGNLDFTRFPMRLHTTSRIDRISP